MVDEEPLAALYGRADHLKRQECPLSAGDRVGLMLRALYLLAIFAPFLLLGIPLLLLAACLPSPPSLETEVPACPSFSTLVAMLLWHFMRGQLTTDV